MSYFLYILKLPYSKYESSTHKGARSFNNFVIQTHRDNFWGLYFCRCRELKLLDRCKKLPSEKATTEELSLIHTPDIISMLQECETKNEEELEDFSSRYDSVYINQVNIMNVFIQ